MILDLYHNIWRKNSRPKWVWDKSLNGGKPKEFPTNTLKQGDTTQLLGTLHLRKPVLKFINFFY